MRQSILLCLIDNACSNSRAKVQVQLVSRGVRKASIVNKTKKRLQQYSRKSASRAKKQASSIKQKALAEILTQKRAECKKASIVDYNSAVPLKQS